MSLNYHPPLFGLWLLSRYLALSSSTTRTDIWGQPGAQRRGGVQSGEAREAPIWAMKCASIRGVRAA